MDSESLKVTSGQVRPGGQAAEPAPVDVLPDDEDEPDEDEPDEPDDELEAEALEDSLLAAGVLEEELERESVR